MAQPDADGEQLRSRQLPPSPAASRSLSPQRAESSARGPAPPSAAAVAEPPAMSDEKRVGLAAAFTFCPLPAYYADVCQRCRPDTIPKLEWQWSGCNVSCAGS